MSFSGPDGGFRKSVLSYANGNQSVAAEILGLNRGTLRKKLQAYDLLPK